MNYTISEVTEPVEKTTFSKALHTNLASIPIGMAIVVQGKTRNTVASLTSSYSRGKDVKFGIRELGDGSIQIERVK